MKIVYVAPRYHTNQVPIMEGLITNGDEVLFLSQIISVGENHDVVTPIRLGYSKVSVLFLSIYAWLKGLKTGDEKYAVSTKIGIPPILRTYSILKQSHADIVTVRERSLYSMVVYQICKILRIPCILYNQSAMEEAEKEDLLHRLVISLNPPIRMTPVKKIEQPRTVENCFKGKNGRYSYYIPFVMHPMQEYESRVHFEDDMIHIVYIARYEARKQIPLLLQSFQDVMKALPDEKMHLTVVGEVVAPEQVAYYQQMVDIVQQLGLEDSVSLLQNYNRTKVFALLQKSDLFVMPSWRERASICQLEAMSCGVPVICSDSNGTACHIVDGKNGYLFQDLSREDLTEKMLSVLSSRDELRRLGDGAYSEVCENYSFKAYREGICRILKNHFGYAK